MNIFFLHNDPVICAEMHVNKHVTKMVIEYAQLLSTAHRVLDGVQSNGFGKTGRKQIRYVLSDSRESILYTATHINHPSAIWVRQSRDNYAWLWSLLNALCKEYTYRYGKVHKVEREGLLLELWYIPAKIAEHPTFTEPTPAMPDEVKIAGDSIASYRNYYRQRKNYLANWSGKINSRPVPNWFV
jgi:hypothetical protein